MPERSIASPTRLSDRPGTATQTPARRLGVSGALGAVIALSAGLAPSAESADAAAGRAKAQGCVTCHGPIGISQMPGAPNLAGQPAIYLAAQLRAFRSGKRVHEVMNVAAKPLSDADIENLAAWYSSIEISAKPPAR